MDVASIDVVNSTKPMIGKQKPIEKQEVLRARVPHLFPGGRPRSRGPHRRPSSHPPSPLQHSMTHNSDTTSDFPTGSDDSMRDFGDNDSDQYEQTSSSGEHQSLPSANIAPQIHATVDDSRGSTGNKDLDQSEHSGEASHRVRARARAWFHFLVSYAAVL